MELGSNPSHSNSVLEKSYWNHFYSSWSLPCKVS